MKKGDIQLHRSNASHKFVLALSIVSILGFAGIVSLAFFDFDMTQYIEAALMIIIGIGLIFEVQFQKLKGIRKEGLSNASFTNITTIIVSLIAIIAGIFSIPQIRIEHHVFSTIRGIISIIAIIVIIIQTWIIKQE